jgi:hypothetical protein
MSYYLLPKNNNLIVVKPKCSVNNGDVINPFISQSLFIYYNEMFDEIHNLFGSKKKISTTQMENIPLNIYEDAIKQINPYEYLFSKVPGSNYSVSKLKPSTNKFYDIFEMCTSLNMLEVFKGRQMNSLHISKTTNDSIECFEMFRESHLDHVDKFESVNDTLIHTIGTNKYDLLYCEITDENLNAYVISFIEIVMLILRNQDDCGMSIIKISHVFYKPIVDLLYLLSSLFEKVYIIKPTTSNVTTFEKYLVCKKFMNDDDVRIKQNQMNYLKLFVLLRGMKNKQIISIVEIEIPHIFKTKLNEINTIMGQQQLEALDTIIYIFNNKNQEKMETIKKINIQKSVNWCEKHKIPCNSFNNKLNLFVQYLE